MRLDRLFQKRATPESTVEQGPLLLQKVAALYEQVDQPTPDESVLQKFVSGELTEKGLEQHLKKIEASRASGQNIVQSEFQEIVRYGLKNLADTAISAQVLYRDLLNVSGINLAHADLTGSMFNNVNFSGANMEGVVVNNTVFNQSLLYSVEMPSVVVMDRSIDLEAGSVTIAADDTWNVHKSDIGILNHCSDCEAYNEGVLNMVGDRHDYTQYARRGIVLFQEGQPLGMLKLKGTNTFLAMRTVRDTEGDVIFWKGMVYAFEKEMNRYLTVASMKVEDALQWRRADTENIIGRKSEWGRVLAGLGRNNIRFIEKPAIFDRLDELTADIEAGKEPMVDIFE